MSKTMYEYRCSNGHEQSAPYELKHCVAYVKGKPCAGSMVRVGAGSRKGKVSA